jgi:GMP synthase (glutamine-hydrolysing)
VESLPKVVIIDLGSQYTLVIERTIRELGIRSVVLDPKRAATWLESHPVDAVILSGGAASVYEKAAPQPPENILRILKEGTFVPTLGICYGMQWISHCLGGKVEPVSTNREYGDAEIAITGTSRLFAGIDSKLNQKVWASHGDTVVTAPKGFSVIATSTSEGRGIAAMENSDGTVFGVQFHPEVTHTPEGKRILQNFLVEIAGCTSDWEPSSMVAEIQTSLRAGIAPDEKAIFGFSGGVDSTVLAAIAAPVLGNRLLAVLIDGGHLRENEIEEIRLHAAAAGVQLQVIDARQDFESVMINITDAEEKRRCFKKVYAAIFRKEAKRFGATIIFQGTLAPDRIESGATGGALIKSHHNVGLDFGELKQAHPIDHLFKYEVRALARELELPESVWNRQPFPGPGLFLRVNGIPATQDKLEIVRWAEARVREILERRGLYSTLSQLIVHLLGVKMVGVKGDARVYAYPVGVRAIKTIDFMTATGVHFDDETEDEITTALTRHREIVCVMFNPTDKPPATTEPE